MSREDEFDDDELPRSKSGMSTGVKLLIASSALLALLIVCGGIGTALAIPAIQQARETERRELCKKNLEQLKLALQNYQLEIQELPTEVIPDTPQDANEVPDGTPAAAP